MTILISFFANTEVTRLQIVSAIQNIGSWARINDCAYAIKDVSVGVVDIRNEITRNVEKEDYRLFVVDISKSAWGSYKVPKVITEWLKNK